MFKSAFLALLAPVLLWSTPAIATAESQELFAIEATGPVTVPVVNRPVLSQGDPRWGNMRLGPRTVRQIGCLVVSIFDVLRDMGYDISPVGWIRLVAANALVDHRGWFVWSLRGHFPVQVTPLRLQGAAALNETRRQLENGSRVLLEVLTERDTKHWIVVEGILGNVISIRDSNGGRRGTLDALYGGIQRITRIAVIRRT